MWYIAAFAAGVVSSETVRRLWAKYVTPKLAEWKAGLDKV